MERNPKSWIAEPMAITVGVLYAFMAGKALARWTGAEVGSSFWEAALGALLGYLFWLSLEARKPDPPGTIDGNDLVDQIFAVIAAAAWGLYRFGPK